MLKKKKNKKFQLSVSARFTNENIANTMHGVHVVSLHGLCTVELFIAHLLTNQCHKCHLKYENLFFWPQIVYLYAHID